MPLLSFCNAVDELDRNRLGLEYIAYLADFFIERFTVYGEVAMNVCKLQGDLQGAAEVEKRRASADGALTVVQTAGEREALVSSGQEASRVVAREDMRLALSIV